MKLENIYHEFYCEIYIFSPLSKKVIPLKFLTTRNADIWEIDIFSVIK